MTFLNACKFITIWLIRFIETKLFRFSKEFLHFPGPLFTSVAEGFFMPEMARFIDPAVAVFQRTAQKLVKNCFF